MQKRTRRTSPLPIALLVTALSLLPWPLFAQTLTLPIDPSPITDHPHAGSPPIYEGMYLRHPSFGRSLLTFEQYLTLSTSARRGTSSVNGRRRCVSHLALPLLSFGAGTDTRTLASGEATPTPDIARGAAITWDARVPRVATVDGEAPQ
ncbi:hypothetical protein DFH09DRAFT_1212365 [Mycena vulgaris]|nr:hypothetical protein DFH09DRAFT_1212365 [Mycena vulgaris]